MLIPNALQPAEIDEVMLCHLLGRAIVLVRDDQLSLAIGRRGQNVRLASKLVGWDIEIMTAEELDEVIEKAVKAFEKIEGVDTELAERLVEQGILSYDDLSVMEIADLVNTIEGLTEEQATEIVAQAETLAEEQTEELPRRKGARIASSRRSSPPAEPRRGRADGGRGRGRQSVDGHRDEPSSTTPSGGRGRSRSHADATAPRDLAGPRRRRCGLASESRRPSRTTDRTKTRTDGEDESARDDETPRPGAGRRAAGHAPRPRGDVPAQRRRPGRSRAGS